MQITRDQITPTKVKLSIVADPSELDTIKQHVLKALAPSVKVQGFRQGKAPQNLIEKQIDPAQLQAEFLDHAVNDLYVDAVQQEKLRPVSQPEVSITKFVPYSVLEVSLEVDTVGEIKLADYKSIKLDLKKADVTAKEVNEVLENLRVRAAEKKEVDRAAKTGDEAVIDFTGTDAKTKHPIDGADGKDYPLTIGSGNFIPGFEEELVGIKPGGEKDFEITFPKDYGVADMQNRKVNFHVKVRKVNELAKPDLDDAFAGTVGPFKTLADLKADIEKQLKAERQSENQRAFDNELLEKITGKSEVPVPESLIEEEVERIEEEEKRSIVYRGQTWQEHLDAEGVTAEEHKAKQRPAAELRVKAGMVLGEIADKENITVTPEELEIRLMLLKNQYTDDAMHAELDKPENRRDIQNRLMTEKALDKLREYATAK